MMLEAIVSLKSLQKQDNNVHKHIGRIYSFESS